MKPYNQLKVTLLCHIYGCEDWSRCCRILGPNGDVSCCRSTPSPSPPCSVSLNICLCLFSFCLSLPLCRPSPPVPPRPHSPQSVNVNQYILTHSLGALQALRQIPFCQACLFRMLNMSTKIGNGQLHKINYLCCESLYWWGNVIVM